MPECWRTFDNEASLAISSGKLPQPIAATIAWPCNRSWQQHASPPCPPSMTLELFSSAITRYHSSKEAFTNGRDVSDEFLSKHLTKWQQMTKSKGTSLHQQVRSSFKASIDCESAATTKSLSFQYMRSNSFGHFSMIVQSPWQAWNEMAQAECTHMGEQCMWSHEPYIYTYIYVLIICLCVRTWIQKQGNYNATINWFWAKWSWPFSVLMRNLIIGSFSRNDFTKCRPARLSRYGERRSGQNIL